MKYQNAFARARALRDKNRVKKIVKLSESHIDKSLDTECEELSCS